jgi:hypothetical protein
MFIADANNISGNRQEKFIEDALHRINEAGFPIKIRCCHQCSLPVDPCSIQIRLGDFEQAEQNLQASLATHHKWNPLWYYSSIVRTGQAGLSPG